MSRRPEVPVAVQDAATRARSQTCDGSRGQRGNATRRERERVARSARTRMKEATAKSVNTYFVAADRRHRRLPGHARWRRRWASRGPTARRSTRCPSITLGTQEMSPLTMAERVRHLRQPRRVLHARRHRVDHRRAAARALPVPKIDVLARDGRDDRRHHQHPAARAWSRTAPAQQAGLTGPRQRRQDRYDGRALRGLVRRLHAEHVRRGLGRRPGTQDVRWPTSPSAACTTTRSSAARSPARSGGTR